MTETLLSTKIFKMGKAKMFGALLSRFAFWWLFALGLLTGILLVAGVAADIRYAIVALLLVFIVIPGLGACFYLWHGLAPATALNILPHHIIFSTDGMKVVVQTSPLEEKENEDGLETEVQEYETRCIEFPYNELDGYNPAKQGIYVNLTDRKKGFLYIPYSAFNNTGDFKKALSLISRSN